MHPSNALKFTSKTARAVIRIEGLRRGNESVYLIRDNGAGFDKRYAGELFSVFQRLHSSHEYEGNGIGLATVQRIITMHGGRVWAEGEEGKGAVFSFSLPGIPPAQAPRHKPTSLFTLTAYASCVYALSTQCSQGGRKQCARVGFCFPW